MILDDRLNQGDLIILDGATGSELKNFGAVLDPVVWCGSVNLAYPEAVQAVHEAYIRAGADVITTNTYATCRHVLDGAGLGEQTVEINRRAVELAMRARDTAADGREIAIAGSLSSMRAWIPGTLTHDPRYIPENRDELLENLTEQAETLKDDGVDFLILEMMRETDMDSLVAQAAKETGLRVWTGLSASSTPDNQIVGWAKTIEYPATNSQNDEIKFVNYADLIDRFMSFEPQVMGVMHSTLPTTSPALSLLGERWTGPMMAYPETIGEHSDGRREGIACNPEEFATQCAKLVSNGIQIIGGCCGTTIAHLRALSEKLDRLPG